MLDFFRIWRRFIWMCQMGCRYRFMRKSQQRRRCMFCGMGLCIMGTQNRESEQGQWIFIIMVHTIIWWNKKTPQSVRFLLNLGCGRQTSQICGFMTCAAQWVHGRRYRVPVCRLLANHLATNPPAQHRFISAWPLTQFVIQCKPQQIKCWGLLTIICKKRIENRLKTVKKIC